MRAADERSCWHSLVKEKCFINSFSEKQEWEMRRSSCAAGHHATPPVIMRRSSN
jgi:hypothetical protein